MTACSGGQRRAPRSLRRAAFAVAAAALLSTTTTACSGSSSDSHFRFSSATRVGSLIPAAERKPAQAISGSLLDGGKTALADDKGKVVVLNFWASWCGPCKVETPQLDLLYRRVHTKGVQFIGVDTKDQRANAKFFVTTNKISYPIVYDEPGEVALRLGNIPGSLPFTALIDKKQKVAAVYLGALTAADLSRPLDTLLAER